MGFLSFLKELFNSAENVNSGIKTGFRFTQKEIKEIVSVSKRKI